jgi:3-hydroxyisobutyrate dehydrogenase-like beta-hydroxyacid dehydrogenase
LRCRHDLSIGFVGFGEAGFHIAKGLRAAGVESLSAFDIDTAVAGPGEKIRVARQRRS